MEMKKWASKDINLALVSASNHYAGFDPDTVRKIIGLQKVTWRDGENKKDEEKQKDKSHLHSSNIQQHHSKQSTFQTLRNNNY
jgi:hypothetical protein